MRLAWSILVLSGNHQVRLQQSHSPNTDMKTLGVSLIGLAWTAGFDAPGQRENLKAGLSGRGVWSPVSLPAVALYGRGVWSPVSRPRVAL